MIREFSVYKQKEGFVDAGPPDSHGVVQVSQNQQLFTAYYAQCLHDAYHLQSMPDLYAFEVVALRRAYEHLEFLPGLHKRHLTASNQNSQDNYLGILLFAKHFHPGMAMRIYEHGLANKWTYNTTLIPTPTASAVLGRYPSFIANVKFAVGERPTRFQSICWSAAIAYASLGRRDDYDNWTLAWVSTKLNTQPSFWEAKAIDLFQRKLKSHYQDGFGQLLGEYFKNPFHPAALYLRGY